MQLLGFGATFAITQTVGKFFSLGDYLLDHLLTLFFLLPIRTLLISCMPFTKEELAILDRSTASVL